ncbi:MAG: sensor histidine kinase [Bacteroidia bacterium]
MFISKTSLFLAGIILILLAWIVYLLIKTKQLAKSNQQRQLDYKLLENKINSIELESVKYKINPHLFKNILNSIQSHAYQTYFSLDKLSNVLDYILYETDKRFVTIKEEVDFALNLIEINKLKLSPLFDLKIKNKINEEHPFYNQQLLSPLITVDLIENAFKHADIQSGESFISITLELKDDFFAITVANKISSKPALKKSNSGVGKVNMQKRLELVYRDCYKLEEFIEKDVFISHLKINLIDYKNKVLVTG